MNRVLLIMLSVASLTFAADYPKWIEQAISDYEPSKFAQQFLDNKDVDAITIWDYGTTKINKDGNNKSEFRIIHKILRQEGKVVGKTIFSGNNEKKLKDIKGWLISKNGTKEIGKKQLLELNPGGPIYDSDYTNQVLAFSHEEIEIGDYVAFETQYESNAQLFSLSWFVQGHGFPVMESTFELTVPENWTLNTHLINYDSFDPLQPETNKYIWQFKNVGPTSYEEDSPPALYTTPQLWIFYTPPFATNKAFNSWDNFSTWYYSLWEQKTVVTENIAAVAAKEQTVQSILEYVQKNIKYVFIAIDFQTRYVPNSAEDIFYYKYGDCKDKSCLAVTMLKSIGVKSFPILCAPKETRKVYQHIPDPSQFNHCIIGVLTDKNSNPSNTIYIDGLGYVQIFDPTHPFLPFGELPWSLQDTFGMVVTKENGHLFKFPSRDATENGVVRHTKVEIDSLGNLDGWLSFKFLGEDAANWRSIFNDLEKNEYKKSFRSYFKKSLSTFEIEDLNIIGHDINSDSLLLECKFAAKNFAKIAGSLLFFQPFIFSKSEMPEYDQKVRHFPFWFSHSPHQQVDQIEIKLPRGYTIENIPGENSNDIGGVSHIMECSATNDSTTVTIYQKYLRTASEFTPEKQNELKEFYKKRYTITNTNIVLKKDKVL